MATEPLLPKERKSVDASSSLPEGSQNYVDILLQKEIEERLKKYIDESIFVLDKTVKEFGNDLDSWKNESAKITNDLGRTIKELDGFKGTMKDMNALKEIVNSLTTLYNNLSQSSQKTEEKYEEIRMVHLEHTINDLRKELDSWKEVSAKIADGHGQTVKELNSRTVQELDGLKGAVKNLEGVADGHGQTVKELDGRIVKELDGLKGEVKKLEGTVNNLTTLYNNLLQSSERDEKRKVERAVYEQMIEGPYKAFKERVAELLGGFRNFVLAIGFLGFFYTPTMSHGQWEGVLAFSLGSAIATMVHGVSTWVSITGAFKELDGALEEAANNESAIIKSHHMLLSARKDSQKRDCALEMLCLMLFSLAFALLVGAYAGGKM